MYVGILVGSPRSSHQRPTSCTTVTSLSEGVNVDVGIIIASVPSRLAPYFSHVFRTMVPMDTNGTVIHWVLTGMKIWGVSLFHGGTPLSLDLCLFMFISWYPAIYKWMRNEGVPRWLRKPPLVPNFAFPLSDDGQLWIESSVSLICTSSEFQKYSKVVFITVPMCLWFVYRLFFDQPCFCRGLCCERRGHDQVLLWTQAWPFFLGF